MFEKVYIGLFSKIVSVPRIVAIVLGNLLYLLEIVGVPLVTVRGRRNELISAKSKTKFDESIKNIMVVL